MGMLGKLLPGAGGGGQDSSGGGGGSPLGILAMLLNPLGSLMNKGGGSSSAGDSGAPGGVARPTPTMGPQMQIQPPSMQGQPFIGPNSGGGKMDLQALLKLLQMQQQNGGGAGGGMAGGA